ncbi:B-cell receptor CD22-like, partial [Acipenser ruthenus]|uniref:B-cell receptor CD22-like n=1 Tax=Acipenser ruthenus TaxID=7906 RepID=UPI0027423470
HVFLFHEEPKVTLDPPVPDHTVKEGSFVNLTCGFDRCTLNESSFVWYREGQPIRNATSNKLQFNVSYEHSGKYCCASAENSSIKSEEINLIVNYSPKNTSVGAPGGIVEGSSVTLTCTSNANPPVSSYTWFRRDGNGDEEKARQQHLNFSSITSSDSGDYYCEAKNSLGAQNSSSVHLSVTAIMRMNMLIYAVAGSVPVIILLILVIIICIKRNKKDQPIEKVNVKSEGGNQELTVINTIYENVNGLPSSGGTQEHVEEIHYGSIQFQERNQPHALIDDKNIPLEDSVIYSTVAKPVS